MKIAQQLIFLPVSAALLLSGCNNVNLSGIAEKVTGAASQVAGGGSAGPSNVPVEINPKQPPSINGDWKVTYVFNGEVYESNVIFAQEGKALTGKGEDSSGAFFISSGTVQGNKVRFIKKYADMDASKPSVEYTGELEFENDVDYTGWRMGGHYKAQASDGTVVDDKWVAISALAEQATLEKKQRAAENPPPEPAPSSADVPASDATPVQTVSQQSPGGSSSGEPHISGMYSANYQFNFKKINSKVWLLQDGHNVTGHGIDVNTNEKFTIPRGWYHYPKLTFVCKYVKGQSAASNRELTIKTTVASGPALKGETQFGGPWEAKIVR